VVESGNRSPVYTMKCRRRIKGVGIRRIRKRGRGGMKRRKGVGERRRENKRKRRERKREEVVDVKDGKE
jgi:hypothetical protein